MFINLDCTAIIKNGTGDTIILDTGASSHMMPHKVMLENYQNFSMPHTIQEADRGTFEAYGSGQLKITTRVKGKVVNLILKDTLGKYL